MKTRNASTGKLSNTTIVTDGVENPSRLLVVDDICDKGGTFLMMGAKLKEEFPGVPIDLYVSHAILPTGINSLDTIFDKIFTHNLFNKNLSNIIEIID